MAKITGGQAVVQTLEACGLQTVFGIPGIHNLSVYKALAGSSLRHVTVRHEQGAGFMADGHARASGNMACALTISGPGLTNIMTPMGEAFHESVPMIVISSQLRRRYLDIRSGALHELAHSTRMVSSVAKESRRVLQAEKIPLVIAEACHLAVSGRPGPVHVEIPLDVLAEELESSPREVCAGLSCLGTEAKQPLPPDKVRAAVEALAGARRPLIVAGGGVCRAGEILTRLAVQVDTPVLLSAGGKGAMDDSNPLCLGVRSHFPVVSRFMGEADVILAVGTELSDDLYSQPIKLGAKLIQIDVDPSAFECNQRADIALQADATLALEALFEAAEAPARREMDGRTRVAQLKEKSREEMSRVCPYADLPLIMEMLTALREVLPTDAVLCADSTVPAYVAYSEFPVAEPRTFIFPYGYGTLGMGLPAAIGAKIANPHRAVCALAGDGGYQFTMAELGVACQENLSLPVIIWDNGGFEEIRMAEIESGFKEPIAVQHHNPDFIKLARAYGIEGIGVRTGAEMQQAVQAALGRPAPTIILVRPEG